MGVKTEYQVVISCDFCYETFIEAWWRQKEVIEEARKEGWSIGKTVKCPSCRKKLSNV